MKAPATALDLPHSGTTDVGLARETNEDAYVCAPPLFIVADGMGGHNAGDVASNTAVEVIARRVVEGEALQAAVREANSEVFRQAGINPSQSGMGTTVTAFLARGNSAEIVHVGDSRAYILRDGELRRVTDDHTVVARLVREGRLSLEEAERHPQRSVLERALGIDSDLQVDVHRLEVDQGDRILLCTDGLTSMISEPDIAGILASEPNPKSASRKLVEHAVNAGGFDNVTAVVVDIPPSDGVAKKVRPRGSFSRRAALFTAAIVVLVGLLFLAARTVAFNSWYVGQENGVVTIFRGIPGSFGGIEFRKSESRTDLRVEELPEVYRRRLTEGIQAEDSQRAEAIVANLRQQRTPDESSPAQGATP